MRASLLLLALATAGCGGNCPEPAAPSADCRAGVLPAGRWTGDWESYPLDDPSFTRSGTIDLVISPGGRLAGQIVEEQAQDRGSLSGAARADGAFDAEYVVSRDGARKSYTLTGSYVCDAGALAGRGIVKWSDKGAGNLQFRVSRAP